MSSIKPSDGVKAYRYWHQKAHDWKVVSQTDTTFTEYSPSLDKYILYWC